MEVEPGGITGALLHGAPTERYFFLCSPGVLPCVEPLSKFTMGGSARDGAQRLLDDC